MKEYKINVLDESHIFSERESGAIHTSYKSELELFEAIQKGSRTDVKVYIDKVINEGITVGKMSDDELRQTKYWSVSLLSLLTRYAIRGGLDETTAYNYCDNLIYRIDKMTAANDIIKYVMERCVSLADLVAQSRENSVYPQPIRKCLHYINTHLHEKLDCASLAAECGLSADYLSFLFKKNMGINLSAYIRTQRLLSAKEMLGGNHSVSDIAYYLGFCSESYFIKCFKKEFGKTPKRFRDDIC